MLSYIIKKDGKRVRSGWLDNKGFEAFLTTYAGDEIIIKKPVVDVLPTQHENEATGKKD